MDENRKQSVPEEEMQQNQTETTGTEHHHHRHHRKGHKRRKKIRKIKRYLSQNKYKLMNLLFLIVFLAVVFYMQNEIRNLKSRQIENKETATEETSGLENVEGNISVSLEGESPYVLVSPVVEEYVSEENKDNLFNIIKNSGINNTRYDFSVPITISYEISDSLKAVRCETVRMEISDNEKYSNAKVFDFDASSASVEVNNLKAGEDYRCRITATFKDESVEKTEVSFETAAYPRILSVEGISNVRDIGGWKTLSGEIVRQGVLYRGSELDGAVNSDFKITSDGIAEMIGPLAIKCDLDLRHPDDLTNETYPLGNAVKYINISSLQYSDILSEPGKEKLYDIFTALAQKDNYPMYLHCTFGLDRSGTICYLLEALLGLSEEDLNKEFELSGLAFPGNSVTSKEEYIEFKTEFKHLEGNTPQEKAEKLLLSSGLTQQQIDDIRSIFLTGIDN